MEGTYYNTHKSTHIEDFKTDNETMSEAEIYLAMSDTLEMTLLI